MNQPGSSDNNHKKGQGRLKWPFIGTLLVGLLLCVVVWWMSWEFHEKSDKFLFVIQSVLNILIFIAIAVQALIYHGQWSVMQDSLRHTETMINQMREQTQAMERQAQHMEDGLGVTRDAAIAAKESADAAMKSANTAEYALIHTERAFIEIPRWEANKVECDGQKTLMGEFTILNSGKLGATINSIKVASVAYGYNRPPTIPFVMQRDQPIDQAFSFGIPINNLEPIEISIEIDYSDRFRRRTIIFGWMTYDIVDFPSWRQCFGGAYNCETEYEHEKREKPN